MTDNRTPAEIERDIERERAGLTQTLDTLQEKFSVEHIVHQIGDQLRENGGDIGRSVARSVKENPLALAVTGVGLAWLIFGKGRDPHAVEGSYARPRFSHDSEPSDYRSTPAGATGYAANGTYGSSGATDHDSDSSTTNGEHRGSFGASSGYAANRRSSGIAQAPRYRHTPDWARTSYGAGHDDYDSGTSLRDRASGAASAVSGAAGSAKDSVTGAASSAGSKVSGAASSAAAGVSSAASRAGSAVGSAGRSVADAARSGRDSVATGLSSARERIAHGTETLSEEARARVIAAREQALRARAQADEAFRRASRRASDFYEEQPLVAGLLAMAAGAAIAGALPRSRMEDEYLGQYSDDLMEEAERIFREETEKAKRVANAAAGEVRKVAEETKKDLDSGAPGGKSAAQAVADKVKSDAQRVADTAKKEAEKQKLGKADS